MEYRIVKEYNSNHDKYFYSPQVKESFWKPWKRLWVWSHHLDTAPLSDSYHSQDTEEEAKKLIQWHKEKAAYRLKDRQKREMDKLNYPAEIIFTDEL